MTPQAFIAKWGPGGPTKDLDPQGWQAHADEAAHFLMQCVLCFFAEDVRLLPRRMFEGLVNHKRLNRG